MTNWSRFLFIRWNFSCSCKLPGKLYLALKPRHHSRKLICIWRCKFPIFMIYIYISIRSRFELGMSLMKRSFLKKVYVWICACHYVSSRWTSAMNVGDHGKAKLPKHVPIIMHAVLMLAVVLPTGKFELITRIKHPIISLSYLLSHPR